MFQSLLNFLKIPPSHKILIVEAVLFLFLAKLLLLLFPFRICIKLIHQSKCTNATTDTNLLQHIKKALYRSDKLAFWKNKCIVLCFAGKWMLNRRKIKSVMCIGVMSAEKNKLNPHAWLKVNDFEIIEKGGAFQELYNF